jgi:hypothetical protein
MGLDVLPGALHLVQYSSFGLAARRSAVAVHAFDQAIELIGELFLQDLNLPI